MNKPKRRTLSATSAALLCLVLLPALPAGADASRDSVKKGKDLFASQCLNCHKTVDEAVGEYRTRPSWQNIVKDMVARGAKLDEEQQAAVVDYLSGRMVLVAKCRGCHSFIRPLTANKSLEDWRVTVERMAQRMPGTFGMTPEQIETLSVFLSVERPAP